MLLCFGGRQEKKAMLSESKPLQVQGETDLKVNLAVDVKKRTFKMYSVYAWGCPLVIVAASHVADQVPPLTKLYLLALFVKKSGVLQTHNQGFYKLLFSHFSVSSR